MASKMGRPADENLPEVVPYQPVPHHETVLPEVVPDSSPEAAQQRYFMETDKYPAYYDTAPKLLHEEAVPPGYYSNSPGQQHQQPWTGAEHSVSAISPNSSVPWQSFPPGGDDQNTYVGSEPEQEKRICGIRKRLFIIIAVILGVVVVAAAVGGGVGGAKAASQRSSDAAQLADSTSASSSITSTTPTTTTTQSSTTSSAPKATITNLSNQTDVSVFQRFAFQGYSGANFTGNATSILFDEGYYDFAFRVKSYIWLPNTTNCCITFCQNKTTSAGWWCDTRRRNLTDVPFPRLSVWCGRGTNTKAEKQCS